MSTSWSSALWGNNLRQRYNIANYLQGTILHYIAIKTYFKLYLINYAKKIVISLDQDVIWDNAGNSGKAVSKLAIINLGMKKLLEFRWLIWLGIKWSIKDQTCINDSITVSTAYLRHELPIDTVTIVIWHLYTNRPLVNQTGAIVQIQGPTYMYRTYTEYNRESDIILCGSRICVREGAQPRFCRHHAVEWRQRQKFGPQNVGSGGGRPGPPGPPSRSAPVNLCRIYQAFASPIDTNDGFERFPTLKCTQKCKRFLSV